ncbi:sugar phosphate isomerase/epimerase [Thermocatellispora tengchongensis]|uniref:Sugar phosphate isomerase/epimerase n=1 Tax=Thermocatellispora tengchongensis TaxID=1073253 RepID=A0A840P287_9ACTN|nr:sugar phosphate isomerase/epimerase family protein [Thermocatellispora tengchongensis]MBB5133472.1 sugar phosphate isomerase/epimerase [Thermocatellispora tengchongensis]
MRPLAFSTLGMPGAPVEEVLAVAAEYGCAGVELRCAEGEPVAPDTPAAELRAVAGAFAAAGVEIVAVCSYTRVARPEGDPVAEVLRHVEIAETLGSPYVRVFGGVEGQADPVAVATARLAEVADRLPDNGVTVLLETHDVFLTGEAVAAVLAGVGSPRVGALWDMVNPWRAGEPPARTADALAPYLRHVQIKDTDSPSRLTPVLPGQGVAGVRGVLEQLDRIGYSGYLALEWERAWFPDAPPVEEALAAFRAVVDRGAGRVHI